MDERIRQAFGAVHAEDRLKESVKNAVAVKRKKTMTGMGRSRRYLAMAAACMLIMLVGGGWIYVTPVASIEIQADPILEVSVNRWNRVIAVNGCNQEGERLAAFVSVTHCHYEEAVQRIFAAQEFFSPMWGDDTVEIVVRGKNDFQCEEILTCMENCADGQARTRCYRQGWQQEEKAESDETTPWEKGYGNGHRHGTRHPRN